MEKYFKGARHNDIVFNGLNHEQSDIFFFKDCGMTATKVFKSSESVSSLDNELFSVDYVVVSVITTDDFLGHPYGYYCRRFTIEDFVVFHTEVLLCKSSDEMYKLITKYNFK